MSNWYVELDKDLNWREAELASLKVQLITTTKGTVAHKVLLRAMWALLYAHYEGFCKFAWDLYLDELQKAGVKRKECKDEIARLSLQKQFKELRGDLSSENLWNFVQINLKNLLEENIDFQVKLETDSNLYPNVLMDNSRQACLDCILVDQYKIELRTLVVRRNYIAHGKEMTIQDITEYQKYEKAALEVMHELAISIVECLDKKLYLKIP
ncbi:MAG: MAE_28990/MAE_18760 family HEPN-like nuclease [Nostoc sp.]|uniref:MAE_28990/MAE_18760 family HEPN-like nuclease n=1 Tax=Nostoc sp. TaxID=1180 RepID=UPI002FFAF21B